LKDTTFSAGFMPAEFYGDARTASCDMMSRPYNGFSPRLVRIDAIPGPGIAAPYLPPGEQA
jgi:hypothetical protein